MKYCIFGAGKRGERLYNEFQTQFKITCFCDNNINKQGTEYVGIPVISPGKIKENGLEVIISCINHFEVAQQLFNLGIKKFHLLHPYRQNEITYIDLEAYDDLSLNPRRICVVNYQNREACANSRALIDYNPYEDIDIVISDGVDKFKDGRNYYALNTSSLYITQCAEDIKGKPCIELFHGFTIKALWYASNDELAQKHGDIYSKTLNENKTVICSFSRLYNIFFGYCGRIPQEKFRITGMPRNDLLIKSDADSSLCRLLGTIKQRKIAAYIPTFRESLAYNIHGMKEGNILSWQGFYLDDFDEFLQKHEILLLIKIHESELGFVEITETSNIRLITDEQLSCNDIFLYEILGAVDLLITDYSSIAVDYLLLDKPIVYAVRDVDEYSEKHGLMTEPFDAWAPGESVHEYSTLKTAILNTLFNEDTYKEKRNQMRQIMHKYNDAQSTRRVLDIARELMEKDTYS